MTSNPYLPLNDVDLTSSLKVTLAQDLVWVIETICLEHLEQVL